MRNWLLYDSTTGRVIQSFIGGDDDAPPVSEAVLAIETPEPLNPNDWRVVDGELVSGALDTRTLPQLKRAKRQQLAEAWRSASAAGVTLGGKTAPTDPESWTRYLALRAMAEDAATWLDVPIPLVDGTFELLTRAKAAILWDALKQHERTLLVKLRAKIEAVQAATAAEEVNAITWE